MKNYTREDILRIVRDKDVEFIRLQFTDLLGMFKNIAVTASQLERALDNQVVADASPIKGFVRDGDSDMYLCPDCNTFEIFPWRPQQGKVARLICDLRHEDGTPFEADPRYILKRAIREAAGLGYTLEAGPECEFFLFHVDENALPTTLTHEQAGYFDISPLDFGENARRDIVLTLEEMGFEISASHHEAAPAQHEIDFKYDEALRTADNIMTFKMAVKTIAKRHGLHATFMPKPKCGVAGSGMHLNLNLLKDGKNAFADENGEFGLSREALYFIGGLMKHLKGMTAVTNPIVNSYRRLASGHDVPAYIAWNGTNRSPLIRIPQRKKEGKRIELRFPDSAANPYLALAVCLQAGIDGIRNEIVPPRSMDCNLFALSREELEKNRIEEMPGTLLEAIKEMSRDSFIKEALGGYAYEKYLELKRDEWDEYRLQISEWELAQYLNRY